MQSQKVMKRMEQSGDLRRFLSNIALAVSRGEMKTTEAAIAVKACEQICVSLYSEIKYQAMALAAGNKTFALGEMPLFNDPAALPETKSSTP